MGAVNRDLDTPRIHTLGDRMGQSKGTTTANTPTNIGNRMKQSKDGVVKPNKMSLLGSRMNQSSDRGKRPN